MNALYTALIVLLIIVSVFFYGIHIGVVKTELKYQKSSNQNTNNGNHTNDQATQIDNNDFHINPCTH